MNAHVATVANRGSDAVTNRVTRGRIPPGIHLVLAEFAPFDLAFGFNETEDGLAFRKVALLLPPGTAPQDPTPRQLELLGLYFWSYKRIAELRFLCEDDRAAKHRAELVDEVRGNTPLHQDLPFLVERYRQLKADPTLTAPRWKLAREFHCSEKTIWQQLSKALEEGLIQAHELPPRRR